MPKTANSCAATLVFLLIAAPALAETTYPGEAAWANLSDQTFTCHLLYELNNFDIDLVFSPKKNTVLIEASSDPRAPRAGEFNLIKGTSASQIFDTYSGVWEWKPMYVWENSGYLWTGNPQLGNASMGRHRYQCWAH